MNYNGDFDEDSEANRICYEHINADSLTKEQQFIAVDYFQWGWEAAVEYFRVLTYDERTDD